jgi:sigma-B regulation protein RsbU (phosphoserine phosphatase)
MELLVLHDPQSDPAAFVRAAASAGLACHSRPDTAVGADDAAATYDVLVADAWLAPDRVESACRSAGDLPVLIVALDGDQATLGVHAAQGLHHLLSMPASGMLVGDAVAAACERGRLRAIDADAGHRGLVDQLEADVKTAHEIQQGFLPDHLPTVDGFTMAASLAPAREVAGDFYDAFGGVYGRRIGFSVSDVCDKGVGAALFMAIFRTLYRSLARSTSTLRWLPENTLEGDQADPLESLVAGGTSAPSAGAGSLLNAVAGTNEYMLENHSLAGYFATTFFGLLDPKTGSVLYINAGHNPPVLVRADGRQTLLAPSGPAVGILRGSTFEVRREHLGPGDALFCYTDGVPEAKDPDGRFFTEQRLLDVLRRPAETAQELLDRVDEALAVHSRDAVQYDDITMLVLHRQRRGAEEP